MNWLPIVLLLYASYFAVCSLLCLTLVFLDQVVMKDGSAGYVLLVPPGKLLYRIRTRFSILGFSCGMHAIMWIWPMEPNYDRILRHENAHMRQQVFLGPLMPVLYLLFSFVLLFVPGKHWYFDNPFEILARRAEKE